MSLRRPAWSPIPAGRNPGLAPGRRAEAGGIGEKGLALLRDLSDLALKLGQLLLLFAALMLDRLFLLLQLEGDGVGCPEDRLSVLRR